MEPTFMECVKKGFVDCCDYSSRSRRKEYWYFYIAIMLYAFLVGGIVYAIGLAIGHSIDYIDGIVMLPLIIFTLPLSVRRLHDTGKTGWWLLIGLTGIGTIILIIFFCTDSDQHNNEYGASPNYSGVQAGLTGP